jgi:hypothetical protein
MLPLAEEARFDLFRTMDKGLQYQQNLSGRQIAILIIRAKSNRLIDLLPHIEESRTNEDLDPSGAAIRVGEMSLTLRILETRRGDLSCRRVNLEIGTANDRQS